MIIILQFWKVLWCRLVIFLGKFPKTYFSTLFLLFGKKYTHLRTGRTFFTIVDNSSRPCGIFFVSYLPIHHFLWYNVLVRSRLLRTCAPLWKGCLPLSVVRQNSLADRKISFLCPFLLSADLRLPSRRTAAGYPLSVSAGNGTSLRYNLRCSHAVERQILISPTTHCLNWNSGGIASV